MTISLKDKLPLLCPEKKIRKNRKNTHLQYGLLWRISSFGVKIFLMLQLKWEILLPMYDIKSHHVTHFCLTWKQGKNEEKYLTFGFKRQMGHWLFYLDPTFLDPT